MILEHDTIPAGRSAAPGAAEPPVIPDYAGTVARCGALLSGGKPDPGAARSIRLPLINVLLGQGAEDRHSLILRSYQDIWANNANQLGWLFTKDVLGSAQFADRLDNLSAELFLRQTVFSDCRSLRVVWYWDVMDDRFDDIFAAVRQHQPAYSSEELFFLFGKQHRAADRQRFQLRAQQLADWAEQTGRHMVLQSDVTEQYAYLPETAPEGRDSVDNSYRVAARLLTMMNSVSRDNLGNELEFRLLNHASLWTVSSVVQFKPNEDIACAVVQQLLKESIRQMQRPGNMTSVAEALCGRGGDYTALFREYLEAQGLLPEAPECLTCLPRTTEILAFEQSLLEAPRRGLFRRNAEERVDENRRAAAVRSLGELWTLFTQRYYGAGLTRLARQPTDAVEWFKQRMCRSLTCGEMVQQLPKEALLLRDKSDWQTDRDTRRGSLADCLHRAALDEVLPRLYTSLAVLLAQAMEELCQDARGFERLVEETRQALERDDLDETILRTYSTRISAIAAEKPQLMQLVPCKGAAALLEQIEERFALLADQQEELRLSLFDELDFRAKQGGGALATEAIQELFQQDPGKYRRLRLFDLPMADGSWCLLNQPDRLKGLNNTGTPFRIPRKDCVERISIYPVTAGNIIY